jgi:hypothetical protein
MTEIETTEIQTVTVTFEEMRWDAAHYLKLRKTKRLVVTHAGEETLVLGPWLPGEERAPAPEWFLRDLHEPPVPIHPEDANFTEKLYGLLRDAGLGPPRPPSI